MRNTSIISKIIPIICFICVFLEAYIINSVGGTTQYEALIFSAYPLYFWILIITTFFLNFLNVFLYIEKKTNYTSVILTMIAAVNSLSFFLLIPYFRGYFFFNPFDSLTHLGYVNDIINLGSFSFNYYPMIHIFIYAASAFGHFDPKTVMFFIPLFFYLIFIVSLFVLVKSVNKKLALIITAFAIMPVLIDTNTYVTTSGMAFLLIPLFLYLFLKTRIEEKNLFSYSILLVFFLLILPLFHMEVAVLLVIMLFAVFLSYRFGHYKNWIEGSKKDLSRLKTFIKRNSVVEIEIMFIVIFTWFTFSVIFGSTVKEVISAFFGGEITSAHILQSYDLSLRIIFSVIKIYGPDLFFIGISGILILYLLLSRNRKFGPIYGPIALTYVFLFILNILTFTKGLILGTRTIKYLVLVSMIIVSVVFYSILKVKDKKFNRSYILSIILIPIIALSIISAYPSPYTGDPNLQVTKEMYDGFSFYVEYKDNLTTLSYPHNPQSFQNAILGSYTQYSLHIFFLKPVDHYGFSANLTNESKNYGTTGLNASIDQVKPLVGHLGNFYLKDVYLIVDDMTRQDTIRFTNEDYVKLDQDDTVNKIYDDGGLNLYYILHLTF